MTSPPTPITGTLGTFSFGSACISDNNGNLLFYTDGVNIYDQTHSVMANGSGLHGTLGLQTAIIVKKPLSSTLYYIITLSTPSQSLVNASPFIANPGLKYSIVDMSLANGNGSVTAKNVMIYSSIAGGLSYAKHCNGNDYWIISHEYATSNFVVCLLNSSGIQSNPTLQNIGLSCLINSATPNICVSSNYKKVACNPISAPSNSLINVFDFDNSTGTFSNPMTLTATSNASVGTYYSFAFSPDCSKLYGANPQAFKIDQFDLCAGSNQNVQNSRISLSCSVAPIALQLATNGKIYLAKAINSSFLGVINNPNASGSACNFVELGQSILPNTSIFGLPNFVADYQRPVPPAFTVATGACQTMQFQSPYTIGTALGPCAATMYSLQSLQWDFGEPISGVANTSSVSNTSHLYGSVGTYTVKLIMNFGCGYGTDTIIQTINVTNSCFNVTSQSITCASLGSATVVNIGTSTGPFSYTWLPIVQNGSVAVNLNPGTYTIFAFDSSINLTHTLTTNFVPLVPLTGLINNSSSVSCYGTATGTGAVTNLAGGSGNQNYIWTNGQQSYFTPTINVLNAGVWNVNVTDALTGCQINQSFYISQPPALTLNISAGSATSCVGSDIVLTATNSGGTPGYTYTWTNGPPVDTYTVSETISGTHTYTLSSTDANNCLTSNTVAVDFVPNPTITVSDVSVCPLATGTLIANGAGSYVWNNTTTGNTFTDSPVTPTPYTVVGSALGCTAMTTASIVLHQLPVPLLNSNSPVCNGQSLILNGSGGNSYSWTGPSGFSSGVVSPTINANPAQSGIYNLTVTSIHGCTASAASSITINPTPTLSATGATVCSSQTLNLVSNSEPGASYLWSGPLNFYSALQSPSLTPLTLNHSGNYTVIATSVSGCTNLAVVNSSVVPPPSLTGQLSSSSLCSQAFNGSPNSITLTAGGANTYSIVTVPDMSIGNPNGPISNLTAIPPVTGMASATLSGSNGVCTATMSLTFSIIPNPSVTVASTPVICAGDSYTYTSQGASSYTWSSATPGFTTYNNGGVAVAHPSINSVFSVFGGSLGCFSASKTSTITVNPLPVISISPLQPTVCLYKSAQLTASGTATGYLWASAPGLLNGTGSTVSVSPLSQQVYTVTGELDNCFASVMTTVNVRALPEPTINTAKTAYCENETIILSGEGGLIYEWQGPNNLHYQKQVISWQSPGGSGGMQWAGGVYSLTVTDANGCQSTATKLITIYESPQGSLLGYKESGCVPLCTAYDFRGAGAGVLGNWTINNQSFGDQFNYCFTEAGTFTITGNINDKSTGCENQLNFAVTVYPKPEADFYYQPLHPVESLDEVKFTNRSTGKNQISWNWYFLNNSGYQSSEENTSFLFTEPGEYPIAFVVSDENFCQDTVMKVIKVEPDFTLYIPDAFTPNGDELNDVFKPVVRSTYLYTLSVFDRWGQRIFYSTSPQTGWDGTFQGVECKMDVYTYKIILSTVAGEKKEFSGHVSLVR